MSAPRGRFDPIGEIYDAAVDPAAFSHVSEIICKAAGGNTSVSYISCDGRVSDVVPYNVATELLTPYDAYFHRVDPMLATILSRRNWTEGQFGDELIPDREYSETEFYRDFARPIGIFHMVACGIPIAPGRTFITGAHRPAGAPRFGRRDKARFDALLPHLQRMLQLRDRLAAGAAPTLALATLDALAAGVVVCDADGRVLFANAAADALDAAGSGLVLGDWRGMRAFRPEESLRLRQLVRDAANGGVGGAVSLTGKDGGQLFALVAPLPRRLAEDSSPLSEPGKFAFIALRPATAKPTFDSETLMRLFDLTSAEASVALAFLAGRSMNEIVAERGVSLNTVKTQLAGVLRKTGTTGQRDLVRLLSLLPPLLPSSDPTQ
jgi:DNA-binding CsgD family transcriptional regulator/PAS domain-containing protein